MKKTIGSEVGPNREAFRQGLEVSILDFRGLSSKSIRLRKLPSLELTVRTWKSMVGRWSFPFEKPGFLAGGEVLVCEGKCNSFICHHSDELLPTPQPVKKRTFSHPAVNQETSPRLMFPGLLKKNPKIWRSPTHPMGRHFNITSPFWWPFVAKTSHQNRRVFPGPFDLPAEVFDLPPRVGGLRVWVWRRVHGLMTDRDSRAFSNGWEMMIRRCVEKETWSRKKGGVRWVRGRWWYLDRWEDDFRCFWEGDGLMAWWLWWVEWMDDESFAFGAGEIRWKNPIISKWEGTQRAAWLYCCFFGDEQLARLILGINDKPWISEGSLTHRIHVWHIHLHLP